MKLWAPMILVALWAMLAWLGVDDLTTCFLFTLVPLIGLHTYESIRRHGGQS